MPKTVAGQIPPYLQTIRYDPAQTPQSVMNENDKTGFAERLKSAAEAKKALLEKMKPKAAVIDPQFAERPHCGPKKRPTNWPLSAPLAPKLRRPEMPAMPPVRRQT